ncbi:MAG: hypothetical protein JNK34_08685 [Tabrizicola sp.]|nr:hypothetical protein [Tabrizicola sp.]
MHRELAPAPGLAAGVPPYGGPPLAMGGGRVMTEYLASTVKHLEDRGIHDRYFGRMQRHVADRTAASCPVGQIGR